MITVPRTKNHDRRYIDMNDTPLDALKACKDRGGGDGIDNQTI